ncbi:putative T7SS-secreted protein [Cellulomonas sp. URHD0024]|uniref:putative T7SS-secreted protein n=1 Tax=Cellulomonas sp. URHD0024 TaxID=1302620 RepID=UPI0012DC39BC|nr:hypothetical protein [Cellulomonas sp. URHD0024]
MLRAVSTGFGASLATCSDATVLVPGSVLALRDDAAVLTERSGALASQAEDVRRASAPAWTGDAAAGWAQRRSDLGSLLDTAGTAHAIAAGVLRHHADAVEWAQGRAQTAVALWTHGCHLRTAAGLPPVGLGATFDTDPGATYRWAGEEVLASAQHHAGESARAAAAVLAELDDRLPDGRWHSGDFLSGVGSWVTGMLDVLWRFHFLRAATDPVGYRGDVSNRITGSANAWDSVTSDPFSAAIQLSDWQTLKDRPAQWWGALSPDIALAAVGGAGVATKVGRGLRVADGLATAESLGATTWDERALVERVLRKWPEKPAEGTPEYDLGYDHAVAQFRPGEYQTATRLIDQYGLDLVRGKPPASYDWIDLTTGKTYDAIGNFPGEFVERRWPRFEGRIQDHLEKADVVPVDVAQFSAEQRAMVKQFVEQFGDRILIVGD